jgi:drug/metabolite transporter, DME family
LTHSTSRARASVLLAALLFATGGAAIKGTALSSFQVAGFRSGIAALALALLLPSARRGFGLDLLPAGVAYATTLVLFVIATKLTTSGAAIFLQSTAPIWVVVLSRPLLGEPIARHDVLYLGAAALAIALVFAGSQSAQATAPNPQLGNVCALASGLCYALLLIAFRRLARVEGGPDRSMPAAVLGNLLAFAACLPLSLPVGAAGARDVLVIVYLGAFQVGLAYFFLGRGLRVLPVLEVSLLTLLEPVMNPLWTWLLHDERPSALAMAGGGLLVGVLFARSRAARPLPQT